MKTLTVQAREVQVGDIIPSLAIKVVRVDIFVCEDRVRFTDATGIRYRMPYDKVIDVER